MFATIVGYPIPDIPGVAWAPPILDTIMYFLGGSPFLSGAVSEIRSRQSGMLLLIGLAITVAFVASWGASLGLLSHQLESGYRPRPEPRQTGPASVDEAPV